MKMYMAGTMQPTAIKIASLMQIPTLPLHAATLSVSQEPASFILGLDINQHAVSLSNMMQSAERVLPSDNEQDKLLS